MELPANVCKRGGLGFGLALCLVKRRFNSRNYPKSMTLLQPPWRSDRHSLCVHSSEVKRFHHTVVRKCRFLITGVGWACIISVLEAGLESTGRGKFCMSGQEERKHSLVLPN